MSDKPDLFNGDEERDIDFHFKSKMAFQSIISILIKLGRGNFVCGKHNNQKSWMQFRKIFEMQIETRTDKRNKIQPILLLKCQFSMCD